MDLIAELHKTFDDLEARVREIFADAAPELHQTVTTVVSDAKSQAADLATQALADVEKDVSTMTSGAEAALETVDPSTNQPEQASEPAAGQGTTDIEQTPAAS